MSEQMMYIEVIKQAMNDVLMELPKKTAKNYKEEFNAKQEAVAWFKEDNPDFELICQEAEVSSFDILRALKAHQENKTKKILLELRSYSTNYMLIYSGAKFQTPMTLPISTSSLWRLSARFEPYRRQR